MNFLCVITMAVFGKTLMIKRVSEKIISSVSLFIFVDSSCQTADVGNCKDHFTLQMVLAKFFMF